MAQEKEVASGMEWRITMADGSSEVLAPDAGFAKIAWLALKGLIGGLVLKVWKFLKKAWDLGHNEPRKVIHCLKVGMALTVVSLFYYMRPLYEGVGGNAMWAVMTVVVVFENNVGKFLVMIFKPIEFNKYVCVKLLTCLKLNISYWLKCRCNFM